MTMRSPSFVHLSSRMLRAHIRRSTPPSSWLSIVVQSSCRTLASSTNGREDRPYIPRRSVMFVPGHDPKKLNKIPFLGVDCAVMECEDGVAASMKAEARKNCKEALRKLDITRNFDLALRVNSVSSGLLNDDLENIIGNGLGDPVLAERLPQTILVPKIDNVGHLVQFTETLAEVKLSRVYKPCFLFFMESAESLMNLKDILLQAKKYSEEGHYLLDGIVFGSDDFCASIGAQRTKDAKEIIYARQKVVALAKAFQLQAIDMVNIDIKDLEGLKQSSEEGSRMGYTGKQVIHPGQVTVVQNAFTPSVERLQWAVELIQGFQHHQVVGEGSFVFRGQMIDMPLLLQAQNVVRISATHR